MADSYITLAPAVKWNPTAMDWNRWVVVVMRESRPEEYIQTRCSEAMKRGQAEALAQSWAAAMHLEVRL